MRAVDDARRLIARFPRHPEHTRERWLHDCGSFFRISASLAKKLWYREQKRIDADTYLRMRERADNLLQSAGRREAILNDTARLLAAPARVASQATAPQGLGSGDVLPTGSGEGRKGRTASSVP